MTAKKVDKDCLVFLDILIDQEGDHFFGTEGLENLFCSLMFIDDFCSLACSEFEKLFLQEFIVQSPGDYF